jgi:hypothetical protein
MDHDYDCVRRTFRKRELQLHLYFVDFSWLGSMCR